eukprot:220012-Amphidinium_carterae.1
MEICGGEARVSQVLIAQSRAVVGPNIDIINGYDLTLPELQQCVLDYIAQTEVPVVLMAPPCTALGPLGKLNRQLNPGTWRSSVDNTLPLATFCGSVALLQLRQGRDFIVEQPAHSWLFQLPPWPQVRQHMRTSREIIDVCRLGLPYRKSTELWSSDAELIE